MSERSCNGFPYVCRWTVLLGLSIALLSSSALGCVNNEAAGGRQDAGAQTAAPPADSPQDTTAMTIGEALDKHTEALMALPGVSGVGQGRCDGQPCIKVFVVEKTPELERKIPEELEGHPVRMEETGSFQARPRKDTSRTSENP